MSQLLERKIKIGLIGCGRIAQTHIKAIQQLKDDLELTAVCDVNENALKEAVKVTSAKPYNNLLKLLENENVDMVVLATPSGLHARHAIAAAKSGKHVITEKPMATRWSDAHQMISECENQSVRLFVIKQNRFNPTIQRLKHAINSQRFGRIYFVGVNVFWARPQSYYDQASWRGTWEFDGGALMNQASHYIDLLPWLIGPVEQVSALTGTLARKIEVEDTATMNLRWRSGTIGAVNVTMLAYPNNLEGSITILGEKGSVKIGGVALNKVDMWQFSDADSDDENVVSLNYEPKNVYGSGHVCCYENIINTLRGKCEPETDGREGLKSLELLIAAYQSARSQKVVSLPLVY